MGVDGNAAEGLVGLPGFWLLAVSEAGGEVECDIETVRDRDFCRSCGVLARPHGQRMTLVRDLPAGGRPVRLRWRKRLWRCAEPPCPAGTWTQTSQQIRPRAVLTERARAEVCRRVGWEAVPVARIAAELGVGWATVMRAVREHGQPLIDDPARLDQVTAFGVDETAFLAATSTHATLFVTGMVDLARPRLLDVVPGRSGAALAGWVAQQPTGWHAA